MYYFVHILTVFDTFNSNSNYLQKCKCMFFKALFLFWQAYDNNESPVRKAAVFCMVAIHMVVGEAMQPHLASLNSCKVCVSSCLLYLLFVLIKCRVG